MTTPVEPAAGTRIAAEIGTAMVLELPGIEAKIKTTLVGMQPGEYLILKPPRALNVKLFQMGKSPKAVVRYVFGGRVFGFETPMIGVILEPVGLVFLAYPKTVHEHNLRSAQRVECQLPARAKFETGEFIGVALDLSQSGTRISLKTATLQAVGLDAPALDTPISLDIQLPWEGGMLALNGRIKNIEHDAARLIFGVAFIDLAETTRTQIARYIAETE